MRSELNVTLAECVASLPHFSIRAKLREGVNWATDSGWGGNLSDLYNLIVLLVNV